MVESDGKITRFSDDIPRGVEGPGARGCQVEMSVLKAVSVAKSYGGRRVVNGVNLAVQSGEVVGLLGPNGAGKTTTFHMMVGSRSA